MACTLLIHQSCDNFKLNIALICKDNIGKVVALMVPGKLQSLLLVNVMYELCYHKMSTPVMYCSEAQSGNQDGVLVALIKQATGWQWSHHPSASVLQLLPALYGIVPLQYKVEIIMLTCLLLNLCVVYICMWHNKVNSLKMIFIVMVLRIQCMFSPTDNWMQVVLFHKNLIVQLESMTTSMFCKLCMHMVTHQLPTSTLLRRKNVTERAKLQELASTLSSSKCIFIIFDERST